MIIRNAIEKDFDDIMRTYSIAREYMKNSGNKTQWGDTWPPEDLIRNDFVEKHNFVIEIDKKIHGVFAFILGEDPTYVNIEGKWKSSLPYGTIHRIASDGCTKGIFHTAVDFCKKQILHLRIDTHIDNKKMIYLIEKENFKKCGIIYVGDGSARLAYELI